MVMSISGHKHRAGDGLRLAFLSIPLLLATTMNLTHAQFAPNGFVSRNMEKLKNGNGKDNDMDTNPADPEFETVFDPPPKSELPERKEVPLSVNIKTKGEPKFDKPGKVSTRRGEMDVTDFGPDFSKVPVVKFQGLGESKNKPLIFKIKPIDAPRPTFWKETNEENIDIPNIAVTKGEPALAWYGEQVGKGGAIASFLADMDGNMIGSINDGDDTYEIKSVKDSKGKRVEYVAFKLSEQPDYEDSSGEEEGDLRRLSAKLRGGMTNLNDIDSVIESDRGLQYQQCVDIDGFYGKWYDSDGPYFSCDWYAQSSNYCAWYGSYYENFGFTANQACCACGGGGTTVDTMVVYTTAAANGAGGHSNMKNLINLSTYQTNAALSNSGISARIRLVNIHWDYLYNDDASREFLDDITDETDTDFWITDILRDVYGADMVVLIGEHVYSGRASNVGSWVGTNQMGFAEVKRTRSAMAGDYTFAHEVGHILGAHHNYEQDPSGYRYAHGYIDSNSCFRTIMSYWNYCTCSPCYSILQFSNTLNSYQNKPTGDSIEADNARAISDFSPTIANLRPTIVQSVELCKHSSCDYGTYRATTSVGDWASMPPDIGNDELTLVKIPRGLSFEYFEHTNFGGWRRAFGSPDYHIELNMGGHNDAVSSFKVRQIPSGKVKLCKHSDCTGGVFYASVGNWATMPGEIGNDQLSFVHIPRGHKFHYFEHTSFDGWNRSFGSKDYGINLSMGGHNDAVSSFIVSVL